MKTINQVITTNDYSMFKIIDGNRSINKLHLKRLKQSIKEKYITVPIIVNHKFQIIDGQHRFNAAKELGKPINYIKVNGLDLADVHRLNTNSKNWTADSYMDGYCKLGMEEYIKYRDFKNKYGFGHNETNALLTNRTSAGGHHIEAFNHGTFKIADYNLAVENADKITQVAQYYDGYKRRGFIYAMLQAFTHPKYNHNKFLSKLSFQKGKLYDCSKAEQYLELIQKIYNFKRSDDSKIRLVDVF